MLKSKLKILICLFFAVVILFALFKTISAAWEEPTIGCSPPDCNRPAPIYSQDDAQAGPLNIKDITLGSGLGTIEANKYCLCSDETGNCAPEKCITSWSSQGLWTKDPVTAKIYYNTANVGIGTTAPTQKLQVVGTSKFQGHMAVDGTGVYNPDATYDITTPGIFAAKGEFTNLCLGSGGGGNCLSSWSDIGAQSGWTDDGTVVRLSTATDKVGIGTAAPKGLLDVAVNGNYPNIILSVDTSSANNNADYWIKTLGSGGATDVINYIENWGGNYIWQKGSASGPVEIMRIDANNNRLGIGTATPTQKLEVNGTIKATSFDGAMTNPTLYGDPRTGGELIGYNYDMLIGADKKYTITKSGISGIDSSLFDGRPETGVSLDSVPGTIEISFDSIKHYLYALALSSTWGTSYDFSTSFKIEKYYDTNSGNGWDGNCDNSEGDLAWGTVADVNGFSGYEYITRSGLGSGICRIKITFNDEVGSNLAFSSAISEIALYHYYYGDDGLYLTKTGQDPNYYASLNFWGSNLNLVQTGNARAYIDSKKGIQLRLDSDNNDANADFAINNGTNSTIFNVQENGNVGIGTTAPGAKLQVNGNIKVLTDNYSQFILSSHHDDSWRGSFFEAERSRGTAAAPTAVVSGDTMGYLDMWAYDGNSYERSAQLGASIDGAVSDGILPSKWSFSTTNSAGIRADRMVIKNDGNVGIGTNDPGTNKLKVAGTTEITGDLVVGGAFNAGGADLAEEFTTKEKIEEGTVLIMGEEGYKSAKPCDSEYDIKVIGVVSDNAAVIMGHVESEYKAIVTISGVVTVKVFNKNGIIKKGDLLTTSSVIGYAMKAEDAKIGTVIGKALEECGAEKCRIKALINLQ